MILREARAEAPHRSHPPLLQNDGSPSLRTSVSSSPPHGSEQSGLIRLLAPTSRRKRRVGSVFQPEEEHLNQEEEDTKEEPFFFCRCENRNENVSFSGLEFSSFCRCELHVWKGAHGPHPCFHGDSDLISAVTFLFGKMCCCEAMESLEAE